ncbi:hypothetical protein [Streptomyces sp. CBMA29]|uniref:hypothetical protein n=1 Tax=Streptomyces sp. CBMA29 TaxID=1896314 RepID=UPI001661BC00|nr:hypothetical protein [Streptomyces sp. CBMA29]MBD0738513.1 hypothetical protein [Streptomyces sp. CBMA29]
MSGRGEEPAGADQGPRPRPDDRPAKGPEEGDKSADEGLFGAETDPAAKEGRAAAGVAAARIARESREAFSLHDSSTYIGGTIGAVNFQFGEQQQRLLAGPLPEEELRRLRDRFTEPPGYENLKRQLRGTPLLVLSGQPGTGRMFTALSLLDDLARGKVARLDPETDLTALGVDDIAEGHGYALEPADGHMPTELHLDRLCRLLGDRGAYAVLLAVPDPGITDGHGVRYHRMHEAADPDAVLDGHLEAELDRRLPALKSAALNTAARLDIRQALGLEALRPAEAARFAASVGAYVSGRFTEEELVADCRGFAVEQVRQWFAGGTRAETLPALRDAAYRIAMAVFGRGSFNTVAEAAELLAWELAVTVDPERVIGRPLLSDGLEARLASTRAVTEVRTQPVVADRDIPVRTVRFAGENLAPALLAYLWEHHHNMRGPVLRWLDSLCQDPRDDVWTRAAVAAGELCRLDCAHTLSDLLMPMAEAEQARRGVFVATALESVLRDGQVGAALRSMVKAWSTSGNANLRWTAAAVLSRGTATAAVSDALGRLGAIGTWEEGRLRVVAAESVVHLLGSDPGLEPLDAIRRWLNDNRRHHQDLGLVATVLLAEFQTEDVWNPAPELSGREKWPLALAVAAACPDRAQEVAGLLWTALNTSRSYEAALDAVTRWLRSSQGEPWEKELLRFLPLLMLTADDRQRLASLIKELSEDPDDPLGPDQSRRLRRLVEE